MKKNLLAIMTGFLVSMLYFGSLNAAQLVENGARLYDPTLRVYLPKDANLANTVGFPQQAGSNGMMLQNDAYRFIRSLNDQAYLGFTNWRLPTLAELAHLYHADGIAWVYNNPARGAPFENLQAYYWADGGRSFSFIAGQEISFAAYRHVLPVASLRILRRPPLYYYPPRYYPVPDWRVPVFP